MKVPLKSDYKFTFAGFQLLLSDPPELTVLKPTIIPKYPNTRKPVSILHPKHTHGSEHCCRLVSPIVSHIATAVQLHTKAAKFSLVVQAQLLVVHPSGQAFSPNAWKLSAGFETSPMRLGNRKRIRRKQLNQTFSVFVSEEQKKLP